MSDIITFYDVPGSAAKDIAWSPSAWKVRFVLNIKGLPYKTTWVEFPDIASVAKQINAPHTSVSPSGPQYTIPFIQDPTHNATISDSFKIVQYLDTAYPYTPIIIPKGTAGLQNAFSDMFFEKVGYPIYRYNSLRLMQQLSERSQAYWRKEREPYFGMRIEEIASEGSEKKAGLWKAVIGGLKTIDGFVGVAEGEFIMGEDPTFADVTAAATLTWLKRISGEGSSEWQEILRTDGGRWGTLMKAFERWETVDEEGLKGVDV